MDRTARPRSSLYEELVQREGRRELRDTLGPSVHTIRGVIFDRVALGRLEEAALADYNTAVRVEQGVVYIARGDASCATI